MSNNREFSQLASYVEVSEGNNSIGIATGGTQSIGIATASITFEGTTGYINAKGFYKDGVEVAPTVSGIGGVWLTTSAGIHTTKNVGIGTTNPSANLDVVGYTELDDINVSGIATLGTVQISSGIVTAASGIVTYYGDGSNLTDILTSIIDDTTPQLGGNLDANSKDISGVNNLNVTGIATFQDKVGIGTTQALVALDVAGAIRQELHTPVMPVGLNNDIGVNWTKIEIGADIDTIYSLIYCGNGIVLAGSGDGSANSGNGDIYRSTDFGQTWTKIEMGTDIDTIYSLIYCGNGIVLAGGGSFPEDGDIYRSTDFGQSFNKVEMGTGLDGIVSLVYCGNGIVLAGSGDSNGEGDVYRSTDFGQTFNKVEMGNTLNRIDSLVYCGNGIVLAGSGYSNGDGDVYRSTNFGQSFDKVEMGPDVDIISSLVYCGNGIVLAGGGWSNGEGEVYRSTDFGQTFTAVESQMELDGADTILSLGYCGNGIVLAGSGGSSGEGDIYKSIDFGLTWTKIYDTGLVGIYSLGYCGNGIVLAGGGNGSNDGDIYRSDVGFSQASTIQGIYHQHLTGNIGIGSTQPTVTLDVGGTLNVSGISTFEENVTFEKNTYWGNASTGEGLAIFGTNEDLEIGAPGTRGQINNKVGELRIISDSEITLKDSAGSFYAKFTEDGSAELYYDNSKKLETTNNGVVVTGVLTATTFSGSGSGLTDLPSSGLWSSNSEGIYVLNNVGIGTTTNTDGAKLLIDVGTATTAFDVVGSQGHLFGVTNNLSSGSIFAVNDISGLASIDVDANGTIQLAPYNPLEKVGIGITNPSYKVDVNGDIRAGQTSSEGLILTSPNGTKYRLSVDNSGNLSASAV